MSGHNKWSKIKHKKAATDAKKSKEFSRYARLIAVESKAVGGDETSPSLKAVVDKAKSINMPKDNIARAIAKGKAGEGGDYETVVYEAYGPAGVAMLIEGLTDNRNRTVQEVKHALTKQGFVLAEQGAASWAFTKGVEGYEPMTTMEITEEDGERLGTIIDFLLELDDIHEVYTNAS